MHAIFFVWKVYTGNQISQNFDPIAGRLTKLKSKEIFNDFAISWDPINEILAAFFYFKYGLQTLLEPITQTFQKLEPNKSRIRNILVSKENNHFYIF